MCRKKIGFVTSHFAHIVGGAEVNDFNLGGAIENSGHEVVYFCALDESKVVTENAKTRVVKAVRMRWWYQYALGKKGMVGKALRNIFEFYFLFKLMFVQWKELNQCDYILCTGRPLLCIIGLFIKPKVVQSIRGLPSPFYFRAYHVADGVIFWGGCEKSHPKAALEDVNACMLKAAIESSIYYPKEQVVGSNNSDSIKVISTSRLDPIQQIDGIIKAIANAQSNGFDLKIEFVGDGQERSKLESMASAELLSGTYKFLGLCSRPQVADALRSSDIFMMNPIHTSYSLALKEAATCGLFCVAPETGTVAKTLKGCSGVRLFEPSNQNQMEATLMDVLSSKVYSKETVDIPSSLKQTWDDVAKDLLAFLTRMDNARA